MDGLLLWALSIILSVLATWYVSRRDSRRSTADISQKIEQLGQSLVTELPRRLAETIGPYLEAGREREAAEAIRTRVTDEVRRAVQVITGVGGIPSGENVGIPGIKRYAPRATQVNPGHVHSPGQHLGETSVEEPDLDQKPSGPFRTSG